MRNFRYLSVVAAAALVLSSCGKAVVKGSFDAAPASGKVVAKTIEGQAMKVMDTLELKGDAFRYSIRLKKGQPEFVYLYCGDVKVASLLLSAGDRVDVKCDTAGNWTVSGSEECEALRQNELAHAALMASGDITAKQYVDHYRKMVKYVMSNSKSLTVIPVLFSKVGSLHVFGQINDAFLFNDVADSLETVYPDSRYLRMLRAEAKARTNRMTLEDMLAKANAADFPELNLPDTKGRKLSLTEMVEKGDATLVVFWNAAQPLTKMYNLEVLLPVFKEFRHKGLNIYQVDISGDKTGWAMVVKEQKLPWTNVCDITGTSVMQYGITAEPSVILIHDHDVKVVEPGLLADLRKAVSAVL